MSLNQFINVTVAEKLARLEHEERVRSRKNPSKELAARALHLLEKVGKKLVEPGDELPEQHKSACGLHAQVPGRKR